MATYEYVCLSCERPFEQVERTRRKTWSRADPRFLCHTRRVDIHLQGHVMQIWDGDELIKTVLRTKQKEVRKKQAAKAS